MPLDLVLVLKEDSNGMRYLEEFVKHTKERTEQCFEIVRVHLDVTAERMKKTYDVLVKEVKNSSRDWSGTGIQGDTRKSLQFGGSHTSGLIWLFVFLHL